jgi:hypothetical protein
MGKKEKEIKIIRCDVGETPVIEIIENELEPMQKIVGGYIEVLRVGDDILLICNEEGLLQQLPPNFRTQYGMIVGNVIFVGEKGTEFASLTSKQIDDVMNYLNSVI